MDRDEALKLLRGGKEGVAEWNRLRKKGVEIPDLRGADLRHAGLRAGSTSAGPTSARPTSAWPTSAGPNSAGPTSAMPTSAGPTSAGPTSARPTSAMPTSARPTSVSHIATHGVRQRRSIRGEGPRVYQTRGPEHDRHGHAVPLQGEDPRGVPPRVRLPRSRIEYLPSLIASMEPIQFYSCFISHSSKNRDFAERLHADLQAKGVRCWFDQEDLKIGDKFRHRIDQAIRVHDKLMIVLSEHSIASDWVESEVESALDRERRRNGPYSSRSVSMMQSWSPRSLGRHTSDMTRHIGDFGAWKDHDAYQKAFDRLLKDLRVSEERK